uniref:Sarcosine oxidasee (formaldehyde-forming) n=1 Tax=Plectus sambesii TaxID=2011161 RepID=A0A914WNU7_9BILA
MYDVIVVGAGIVGSWTALHLARAGKNTLLLEQFALPHTRGSSHGQTRAIMGFREFDLQIIKAAYELWRNLEAETNEQVLVVTGRIGLGPKNSPFINDSIAQLNEAGFTFERLGPEELRQRYPKANYSDEYEAIYEPQGGILRAHKAVQTVQEQFKKLGGRIMDGRKVAAIVPTDEHVTIKLANGDSLQSRKTVICPGCWASKVIPDLPSDVKLTTVGIAVTYWREKVAGQSGVPNFSHTFGYDIYGFPSYEYPGLVKLLYHGGPEIDVEERDRTDQKDSIKKVAAYVKEHYPGLEHDTPAIVESCMYTWTVDERPVLDIHPSHPNLILGFGFSGDGFKYSPVSGKILASLAMGTQKQLPFNLDQFRINRF